jgi:O-antigen/teichoic acid export membrane protein
MPQTRRVVKNSSYLVIAQIPVQAANAVYVLILAQQLGVSEFGRFATLWALLAFFQTVIEQGLGRSITRDLASRKFSIADSVVHGLILALGMGILSVGAMTGIGWTLSVALGHEPDFVMLAFVTGASLVPRAIWVTVSAVFNAQQRIGVSAVLSVIGSLSNAALGLVALFAGQGLLGVLVASAIAQTFPMVVAFMLMFRLIWPGDADISRKTLVTMGRSAMPFVVRALLGIVYFRADLLLLTTFVGFEAAGIYQAAYKVLELALVLPGAANSAAYPVISAYLADNRARAARAYQRLLGGMFAIGLPLSVLLFVGANPLVNLLYGQAYSAAAPMLTILAGAILLSYVNAAPITLLSASPRQAALTVVTAWGLVVNLAVNALLIPSLHGQGAALAMIASEAAQCLLLFALTARVLRGAPVMRAPEVLMTLGFVLSAALVYAPQVAFGVTLGPVWLVAIPGLVVYLVGLALFGRTMLEERAFGASSGVWEGLVAQPMAGAKVDAQPGTRP